MDDKQRFGEFYSIVSDVYNLSFDGAVPSVRPLVKWFKHASAVPMSCAADVRKALGDAGILICRNPDEQRFLAHIYLNIINSLNKKPLTSYVGSVPECFGAGMKNPVTRSLVQKWAYPNRQK